MEVSFISQAGSFYFLGTSYSVTDASERNDKHDFCVLWEGESVLEMTPACQHSRSTYKVRSPNWAGGLTWCFLGVPVGLFWVFPVVTAGPLPSGVRHLISHPNSGSCGTQPFAVSICCSHSATLKDSSSVSKGQTYSLTVLGLFSPRCHRFHFLSCWLKTGLWFHGLLGWRQVGGAGMMTASLACMVTRKPRVLLNVVLTIYYVFSNANVFEQ